MCLVRVDQNRIRELGFRERTTEEWIHMAEQAAEAGTLNLLLTGGEVLIRPDFCEIYEAIAKMGFLLTVYTNATRKGRNRVCGRDQRKARTGHLPGVRAEEPASLYAVEIKSQGDYVVGLEPANSSVYGRGFHEEQGDLHMLGPFESETMNLTLRILEGDGTF